MADVFLICGIPGAGKDWFVENRIDNGNTSITYLSKYVTSVCSSFITYAHWFRAKYKPK